MRHPRLIQCITLIIHKRLWNDHMINPVQEKLNPGQNGHPFREPVEIIARQRRYQRKAVPMQLKWVLCKAETPEERLTL